MRRVTFAILVLITFALAAVFGLYFTFAHVDTHDSGCPFAAMQEAHCTTAQQHIDDWREAFTSIFFVLPLLLVVLVSFARAAGLDSGIYLALRRASESQRGRDAIRELLSRGILHAKVP